MKLTITPEWLARQLARGDDSLIGASGTDLAKLRQDVERRSVTPPVLTDVPSQVGQAVRFVREQRGWTQEDLARIADIDVQDIVHIESSDQPEIQPRAVVYLARALGFSQTRLQQLAGHREADTSSNTSGMALKFAARSRPMKTSDAHYESVRALVAVLAEKDKAD